MDMCNRGSAIFLFSLLFPFLTPAHADNGGTPDKPRTVTEVFFPYQYVDQTNRQQGYVTDVVRAILTEAGLPSDFEFLNWTRAYKIAERTPDTLIFSMMRTPKREKLFHWIVPVASIQPAAIFSAAERNLPRYPSLDGYKRHSVCAQEGTPPYQTLLDHGFKEGENLFPLIDVAFSSMILDTTQGPVDHGWYELMLTGRCEYRVSVPVSMWARTALSGRPPTDIVQHIDLPDHLAERPYLYLAANIETDGRIIEAVRLAYDKLNRSGSLRKTCLSKLPDYPQSCEVFDKGD